MRHCRPFPKLLATKTEAVGGICVYILWQATTELQSRSNGLKYNLVMLCALCFFFERKAVAKL